MSPHLHTLSLELFGRNRPFIWLRLLRTLLFGSDGRRALVLIRLGAHFHERRRKRVSRMLQRKLRRDFGCYVKPEAEIGMGLKLPHPNGVVIGSGVRIGRNCTIYHQVTLGGARIGDWQAGRYPCVGDNVTLFAGAKLIGAIDVGDGARVGANAVVVRDVPARHVAVGIPARCNALDGAAREPAGRELPASGETR